jgi:hypothetical protein
MKERMLDYGVKSHQSCDAYFLQVSLSTLNPKHRFFAKDFLPKAVECKKKSKAAAADSVDNSDGFFTGLPTKTASDPHLVNIPRSPSPSTSTSTYGQGTGSNTKHTPGSYQSPQPQQAASIKSGTPNHDVSMEFGSQASVIKQITKFKI